MKILSVISLGFANGGAENGLIVTDEELRSRGHETKVFASDIASDKQKFSDFEFKHINVNNPMKFIHHLFYLESFLKFRKVLKDYAPDVVHLHTMGEASPSVIFLLKNIPTILTIHGPEMYMPDLGLWAFPSEYFRDGVYTKANLTLVGWIYYIYFCQIQRFVYKLAFRNVDLFISVSDYFRKNTPDLKPNCTVYNGSKLFNYQPIKHTKKILFVGRLEKYKGVQFLIEAIPAVIKNQPDARFIIVGDGVFKDQLMKRVAELQIEPFVQFIVWIKQDELETYYGEADIVIVPSLWPEAFGRVGIEAFSVGRPVVGTNWGGIPEWLTDGQNGFLVEPGDAAAIAEKVKRLLSDKELLETFGENARRASEKYTVSRHVDQIEAIYNDVINQYKK